MFQICLPVCFLKGDGATSELGASLFFDSLDTDADGQIEREELESYVGGAIGGHVLDSAEEIDAGIASIFASVNIPSSFFFNLLKDLARPTWMQTHS